MKRNLLRPLTRPVRSPLHSSSVCSQRMEADTSGVGAPKSRSKPTISFRRHRSEIMFGVLVVVFRGDGVAVLGFSSRECQIPLIVSLGILRFGTGGIRNPTLCVARDRPGSAVIHVALLVIFHSIPCSAVKKRSGSRATPPELSARHHTIAGVSKRVGPPAI